MYAVSGAGLRAVWQRVDEAAVTTDLTAIKQLPRSGGCVPVFV